MGDALADEVRRVLTEKNISVDVVIPVGGRHFYESFVCAQTFRTGARYLSRCCAEPGPETSTPLPRGIRQESIRWTNVHHAWPTDEVGTAWDPYHSHLTPNAPSGARTFARS